MTSETFCQDCLDAVEFLLDPTKVENLEHLLSDEAWERFVGATSLSRMKADALYNDLNQLKNLMATEDKDMLSKDQLHREQFLSEFPQLKQKLEENIGKLHALADKVDKVHKDCTISKVVANSTGAVSGILTILGVSLAPVTAGASLVLVATGIGLGTAAAVTSVSTSIVDYSNNKSAKAKASQLVSSDIDNREVVMEVLRHSTPQIVSLAKKCFQSLLDIVSNVRAFKLVNSSSVLAAEAKLFATPGIVSAQRSKQLQKTFGGTALAMTKGAKISGLTTAAVFLLIDVISLVKESIHLHEGSKAQVAAELRQQAQELGGRLETLTYIHSQVSAEVPDSVIPSQDREQGHVWETAS
ncbi:apolipoprotein L3-like [Saccopteryx leptura]|uniref:apolipoprotein L3-like n=1 Tax=Saccopteryx leptura TaxID=249018 RepID=UPI00339CC9B7